MVQSPDRFAMVFRPLSSSKDLLQILSQVDMWQGFGVSPPGVFCSPPSAARRGEGRFCAGTPRSPAKDSVLCTPEWAAWRIHGKALGMWWFCYLSARGNSFHRVGIGPCDISESR